MTDHWDTPWRVGRKLGRTIYAVDEDTEDRICDAFLGIMDDPVVAAQIVETHNASLAVRRGAR